MEQRIQEHLDGWQANTLSMIGRTILTRFVLSSIPIYFLLNIIMPCFILRSLKQQFQNFLQGSRQGGTGVHVLSWDVMCQLMYDGGPRIQSLIVRREAMLSIYVARFLTQTDCLWSLAMKARYDNQSQGSQIQNEHGSSFIWREIYAYALGVADQIRWLIDDGTLVDMNKEMWISNLLLSHWSIIISTKVDDHLWVYDLLTDEGRC